MGLGMVFQMAKIHAPKLLDHEQTEKRGVLCGVDKKDSRSVRFGENSKKFLVAGECACICLLWTHKISGVGLCKFGLEGCLCSVFFSIPWTSFWSLRYQFLQEGGAWSCLFLFWCYLFFWSLRYTPISAGGWRVVLLISFLMLFNFFWSLRLIFFLIPNYLFLIPDPFFPERNSPWWVRKVVFCWVVWVYHRRYHWPLGWGRS